MFLNISKQSNASSPWLKGEVGHFYQSGPHLQNKLSDFLNHQSYILTNLERWQHGLEHALTFAFWDQSWTQSEKKLMISTIRAIWVRVRERSQEISAVNICTQCLVQRDLICINDNHFKVLNNRSVKQFDSKTSRSSFSLLYRAGYIVND